MKEKDNEMLIPSLLEIYGYLIKDGIKRPIYQDVGEAEFYDSSSSIIKIDYPKLSSIPTDPVPSKGTIVSKVANFHGNEVIYFSKMPSKASGLLNNDFDGDNFAVEKIDDLNFNFYNYDPKTFQKVDGSAPHIYNLNIKFASEKYNFLQNLFNNKLKREDVFELVSHKVLPRTSTYKYTEGITYGVSNENAYGVGLTLGTKFSTSGEASVPFVATAKFSVEVSAQLSATFNHKTTITQEKSSSEEISFPGVNNKHYKYSEYSIALYQLHSIYTFEPGEMLQKIINAGAALAKDTFEYNDSTTYLAVTPGAALSD